MQHLSTLIHHPLFAVLEPEQFNQLTTRLERIELKRYDFLYQKNDATTHVYFMVKGTAKCGVIAPDGREAIKDVLHPVALCGEAGLLQKIKYDNFVQVVSSDAVFYRTTVEDFQQFMMEHHNFFVATMKCIGQKLRRTERRVEALIFKDARSRIVDYLKDNASNRGRRVGYEMMFHHCLTQQDIANLTGTSRQTVTMVLNELKKENLIYFNRRKVLIRDMENLA